ncbi:MAG: hypothetical protein QM731_15565 [Chitinophagaceae bacterium]
MSTKNGTLPASNGVSKQVKDEKALLLQDKRDYTALQKALGYQIKIIDKLIEQYYGKNRNIPRGSKFLKWSILKDKEGSNGNTVEIFLNTQKTTRKMTMALQTMNAAATAVGDGEESGDDTTVLTYNIIGAPPSGPTPPKPQP